MKMDFKKRYNRALIRNLHETQRVILNRKALVGMEKAKSYHHIDFFRLSYYAMYNDMITHSMKVLDKHPDSASFWYLYRCDNRIVDSFVKTKSYNLDFLHSLAGRLKDIRDTTHLHIDKKGVFDPKAIWKAADVTRKELAKGIDIVREILQYLHKKQFGEEFPIPDYDGTDATKIIRAAQKAGIIPPYRYKQS